MSDWRLGLIDLFSDTATLPTRGMLEAMCRAPLGDEQRRADPTVNELERHVAELLEQEVALLVPSATMANQIALMLHCPLGGEVLCHRTAHVYNYEAGGAALNARAQIVPLDGEGGVFFGSDVERQMRIDEPHLASTRAVVVENTTNVGGGRVWPDGAFESVVGVCKDRGLRLHLDGARLWNAAVKRGVPPHHWSREVDTVSVCFSKGLGCPFGAVLAGSELVMREARRIKQALGGALRQSGVMAGAMLYALTHHVQRLQDDHERVAHMAKQLAQVLELELFPSETNMLYFRHRSRSVDDFAAELERAGVLVSVVEDRLRICTHLGVTEEDTARAGEIIARCARNETSSAGG